jgi:hypothetical protein
MLHSVRRYNADTVWDIEAFSTTGGELISNHAFFKKANPVSDFGCTQDVMCDHKYGNLLRL